MAFELTPIVPNSAEPEVQANANFDKVAVAITELQELIADGGLPEGGTAGQILYRTANGYEWGNPPAGNEGSGVPPGGTAGQVLTKNSATDGDATWKTPAAGGGETETLAGAHKYWRVRFTGANPAGGRSDYVSVTEIEFRGSVGGAALVPTEVIASGSYSGNPMSNAFDGDKDGPGFWESQQGGNMGAGTIWIGARYTDPVEVYEFGIWKVNNQYPDENPFAYVLEYSDNGTTWAVIVAGDTGFTVANNNGVHLKETPTIAGGGATVPSDGTVGQVLTKSGTGPKDYAWQNAPAGGGDGGGDGDSGTGGGTTIKVVRVKRNTSYAPPSNDWNNIQYQAVAKAEIEGVWSAAEPEKFFAPPGVKRIRFTAFQAFDSNNGNAYIHLVDKNNQDIGASRPGIPVQSLWYGKADGGGGQLVSRWIDVVPGDWFSIKWFYLSGSISAGSGAQADAFVQVECDTTASDVTVALVGPRTTLRRANGQVFGTGWQTILWDTEVKDDLNTFDPAANTGVITVPAGVTLMKVNIATVHVNTGGSRLLRVDRNADTIRIATPQASNEGGVTLQTNWVAVLPGDLIDVKMVASSDLAPSTGFGGGSWLEIEWANEGATLAAMGPEDLKTAPLPSQFGVGVWGRGATKAAALTASRLFGAVLRDDGSEARGFGGPCREIPAGLRGAFTFIARVRGTAVGKPNACVGVMVAAGAGAAKSQFASRGYGVGGSGGTSTYGGYSDGAGGYTDLSYGVKLEWEWFKVVIAGTVARFYISQDASEWTLYETRDFGAAITHYGFAVHKYDAGGPFQATIPHFESTEFPGLLLAA